MSAAPVFEPRTRAPFRERVYALAGHTTYREPSGPSTTQRTVPADHMIAAALSFGRRDPADIGPDIAIDIATNRPANWRKVCEWLGRSLAADRTASCVRLRPYAAHYALWAYNALVQGHSFPPAMEGVSERDHGDVGLYACLLLERAAEDALAQAARKWRVE